LRAQPAEAIRLCLKPALVRAGRTRRGRVRLFLVLDQLEELFAPTVFAPEARRQFLQAVDALARSSFVWIVATVRSDFHPHILTEPLLVALKSGRGSFDVVPPSTDALRRIVEEPARLAGLQFETVKDVPLSDVILRDAALRPELLPLVEYVLRELFEKRVGDGPLTYTAYDALGGVEGALANCAETVFLALRVDAQESLEAVFTSLVTLGRDDGDNPLAQLDEERLIRRRATLASFPSGRGARALVDAFVQARLFTAAENKQSGEASVTVAHESLLRVWPRATQWANQNALPSGWPKAAPFSTAIPCSWRRSSTGRAIRKTSRWKKAGTLSRAPGQPLGSRSVANAHGRESPSA
jgi:hypothetical protein